MSSIFPKKRYTYSTLIATNSPTDELKAATRRQFEKFGNVIDINCSEPLVDFGSQEPDRTTYAVSVVVEVEQPSFGSFENFAYLAGWGKDKETLL
ncbi:MAG: hypothetical protein Q8896_12540 [Bacteroidota bacterium]|nr:hypothetical protein [Bacteroidota bacterium]MDP4235921.1 hypothetical protein [Bacteroidota bacterium]